MPYDSPFNNALVGFYRTAAIVSAVILSFLFLAAPANANYIFDAKTGVWTPSSRTVLAPPNSSSPFNYIPRDTPPSVSSTGAFQNKTGGVFGSPPVSGVSRRVPVTITGTVPKASVNKALLSRLGKGGLASVALGLGIDALLDGIDAVIDQAGNVTRIEVVPAIDSNNWCMNDPSTMCGPTPQSVFDQFVARPSWADPRAYKPISANKYLIYSLSTSGYTAYIDKISSTCPSGYEFLPPPVNGCARAEMVPLPSTDLADAIDSNYQPHPSDYPFLSPDPNMRPQTTEVDPIPRLTLPPTTTTTVDLDTGKTTVVETNIWHDFNVKDNATEQPKIEVETTTKTDTFTDGDLTSSTTITNNSGLSSPEGAYDSDGNQLDMPSPPIDCDLFPTACAWMEWTQEPPEEPDDDLSKLLKEVPVVSETFTITGGAAACPAPLVLNLSQFGSREVSYQPLCDLASTMKYLYLALMSLAAAVLLHRSISRV